MITVDQIKAAAAKINGPGEVAVADGVSLIGGVGIGPGIKVYDYYFSIKEAAEAVDYYNSKIRK